MSLFQKKEKPKNKDLSYLCIALLADVRNALTRMPELYKNIRMVLFGATKRKSRVIYFQILHQIIKYSLLIMTLIKLKTKKISFQKLIIF